MSTTVYVPESNPIYQNEDADSLNGVTSNIAAGEVFKIAPCDSQRYKKLPLNKQPHSAVPKEVRNKVHNRHLDVLPNPKTRVPLPEVNGDATTSYINANFVRGAQGQKNMYICTQGPQAASVINFWRMVWANDCTTILMLTNLVEKGKRKCEGYWPTKVGEKIKFGPSLSVTLDAVDSKADYSKSTLTLVNSNSSRTVGHFYYSTWPDHGAPKKNGELDPSGLIAMLSDAKDFQRGQPHSESPLVVHCSAGVGRAGTCIALDHAIELLNLNKEIDPIQVIHEIRNDRVALVQTALQYKYLHAGCVQYVKSIGGTVQESKDSIIEVGLESEDQAPVAMKDDNPLETPEVTAAQERYDACLQELESIKNSLPPNFVFGLVGKGDIESLFQDRPDGSFFVRRKFKKEPGDGVFILVVKFRGQPTHHALNETEEGYTTVNGTRFGDCQSLEELVEFLGNTRPNWPVALKHPIRNPSKPLPLEAAEKQLKEAEALLAEAKEKAKSDPNAVPVLAEPRYEEPVTRSASTRSMGKRRGSSTSLTKIKKKRESINRKVNDLKKTLADANAKANQAMAQLKLHPAFLHPDAYPRSKCQELLAAGEDGSYFVRQMLPPELEKLAKGNKEGLILVVKFRGMDTHHVLGRDKDNNVTVNNTTYGACPTIDDISELLATARPNWPVALTNPIAYFPETKERKALRKKYEDALKSLDKAQLALSAEATRLADLEADEKGLAELAATGNKKVAKELAAEAERKAEEMKRKEAERLAKEEAAKAEQEAAVRQATEQVSKITAPVSSVDVDSKLDELVRDLPYHLGEVTAPLCAKTLEKYEDGAYFLRQRLEAEPIPKHIKYMMVVRFRNIPTHHIVHLNKEGHITVNGVAHGNSTTFEELINALAVPSKQWPVSLRYPVVKAAIPDVDMLPPVTPKMRRPFSVAHEENDVAGEEAPATAATKKAAPAPKAEPTPDEEAQRAKAASLVDRSNEIKDLTLELNALKEKMRQLETKAAQAQERAMTLQGQQSSAEVKLTVLSNEAKRAETKAEEEEEKERATLARSTGQALWSQLPFSSTDYLEDRLERTFAGLVVYEKDDAPPPPLGEHDQFGFDTHRDLETNQILAILSVM